MDNNAVNEILDLLSNIEIDTSGVDKMELDVKKLNWYKARFRLFIADGVPGAIDNYLEHLHNDTDINKLTRLHILHASTSALRDYYCVEDATDD